MLGAVLAAAAVDQAVAQSLDYPVKAAFLYKFGPFVEWPASAPESAAGPFTLCVVGDDPFGEVLDRAVAGQRVGVRPVAVRRMAAIAAGENGCQVLYAAGSKAQPPSQILAAVQGRPVLTVTDAAHGDGARGMINFVLQDNRVRFDIDVRAARDAGLTISSKLLSLAVNARPVTEGAP